ncbi:MAG: ATP-binding protein [Cyanobacteria bacterium P01_F01_bin.53]
MTQQPARNDARINGGFLSQLKVGKRVSLGFFAPLGIAFLGTLVGVVVGEYYERGASEVLGQATVQSRLLLQAKESIYDTSIYQRELAYLVDNPQALENSMAAFRHKKEDFYQAFGDFQSAYHNAALTPDEAAVYERLLEGYESFARPYFRTVQLQLLQVESLELAEEGSPDREIARRLLLEAGSEPSLLAAHAFADTIQELADLLEAERAAATNALVEAATLRRNIIAISLALSVAISSALAFLISRSIVRPLRLVEQVATAVTVGKRFDLQAPVTTQDEVATLATALNQLINRVRSLLDDEAKRTQALAKANDELVSTQAQMVAQAKLASLGSLTAGISHEIKNPLNFVNNFSALSVEIVDELTMALDAVSDQLESDAREEITDLIGMLRVNVSKIEHHGKRADKIVSNMLLHSRNGKTEWSQVNVNELLDEALKLAYNGMRAKQSAFNLNFETDYDEHLNPITGCAQALNRVFLNIAHNACYAIYQRQLKSGPDFRPQLTVRTREQENQVEIIIRDNGTGMPPAVKDKIFDQFFTTKPTGEGTGLGLSLSYDIIAQQHRGTMEVNTEEGCYTEFAITLPKQRSQPPPQEMVIPESLEPSPEVPLKRTAVMP